MSFFNKAKDAFEGIKDKVTGEGDHAHARVEDAADRTHDRVDDAVDNATDRANEKVDDAADRASQEGSGVLDQAGDSAARGIDTTGDWADKTTGGQFSEPIDSAENTAEGWVDQDGSAGTREDRP